MVKKETDSRTMKILKFFFSENKKTAFRRLCIYSGVIALIIILTLNIEISYSQKHGWDFHWGPAAEIKVNK